MSPPVSWRQIALEFQPFEIRNSSQCTLQFCMFSALAKKLTRHEIDGTYFPSHFLCNHDSAMAPNNHHAPLVGKCLTLCNFLPSHCMPTTHSKQFCSVILSPPQLHLTSLKQFTLLHSLKSVTALLSLIPAWFRPRITASQLYTCCSKSAPHPPPHHSKP